MSRTVRGSVGEKQSNIIGRRFGRWVVLDYDIEASKQKECDCYRVRCDCDIERVVRGVHLRSRRSQSCGCLQREIARKFLKELVKQQMGENHPSYIYGFSMECKKLRKIVRERDVVCQRCGKTDEEELARYNQRLGIHHLDGDHDNNDPENGALLCKGCHTAITNSGNVWRPKIACYA